MCSSNFFVTQAPQERTTSSLPDSYGLFYPHVHSNARNSVADIDFRCVLPWSQAFAFLESTPSDPVCQFQVFEILWVFTYNVLRYHPGKRIIISSSLLNALLPKIWGVSLGKNHLFIEKHKCERPWFSFLPMRRLRACSMESFRISRLGHLCSGGLMIPMISPLLRHEFSR